MNPFDGIKHEKYVGPNTPAWYACNCRGPQNGAPLCPCMMRNVIVRDGRYVQKEVDLGPATTKEGEKP